MNKLTSDFGDFLMKEDWNYFSTLTYKWDVKPKANRINMDKLAASLNNIDKKYTMFWAAEWHRSGTSLHNHLLIKGDIRKEIDKFWLSNNLGIRKYISHLKYDKNKGAAYYISKYIDRDIDYDFYFNK